MILMKFLRDRSWFAVLRMIRMMSSMNLFKKRIAQMKVSWMIFLWSLWKKHSTVTLTSCLLLKMYLQQNKIFVVLADNMPNNFLWL